MCRSMMWHMKNDHGVFLKENFLLQLIACQPLLANVGYLFFRFINILSKNGVFGLLLYSVSLLSLSELMRQL
jgi:hypothetical protein